MISVPRWPRGLGVLLCAASLMSFVQSPGRYWDCFFRDPCDKVQDHCKNPDLQFCAKCSKSVLNKECGYTGHEDHWCDQTPNVVAGCGKWMRAACTEDGACGVYVQQPGDCDQTNCF